MFYVLVSVHKCNDFVSFLLTSLFNYVFAISSKNRFFWILISVENSFALFPSLDVFEGNCSIQGRKRLTDLIRSHYTSQLSSCYVKCLCSFLPRFLRNGETGEEIPTPERWQIPSHSFPCFGYRYVHALFRLLKGSKKWHYTEAGKNQELDKMRGDGDQTVLCEKWKISHKPDWKWCCIHSELDLLIHLAIKLV